MMNSSFTDLILADGLAVENTYHSFIPKDDGNLRINLFFLFGSYGTGIFINKSAMLYLLKFLSYLLSYKYIYIGK